MFALGDRDHTFYLVHHVRILGKATCTRPRAARVSRVARDARARGMTEIAKSAGITREALYKALRADSAPRFDTIQKVCGALGVKLVALPIGG